LENLQLPTFSLTVTNASIILLRRHIQLIAISDNSLEIFCSIDECCNVVNVIQDELGFEALTDIWAIDLLFRNVKKRFAVTVALRNIISGARIRITSSLRENALAFSCSQLFAGANWPERKIWDLFGIIFEGSKDLRRLLSDYGFEGFPLRKDFPVCGYLEVRFDIEEKCVLVEPIRLAQHFRIFDFSSPWERDEKKC